MAKFNYQSHTYRYRSNHYEIDYESYHRLGSWDNYGDLIRTAERRYGKFADDLTFEDYRHINTSGSRSICRIGD